VVGSSAMSRARTACQGNGDHNALPHAARKLERIAVELAHRVRNAHAFEQPPSLSARGRPVKLLVQHEWFGDLRPDGVHRVEARHRLLEHHGQFRPAQQAHRIGRLLGQVTLAAGSAGEQDPASGDPAAGMVDQSSDSQGGDRFAGAGLADQGNGLTRGHAEAEPTHHGRGTAIGVEGHAQVLNCEQRRMVRQKTAPDQGVGLPDRCQTLGRAVEKFLEVSRRGDCAFPTR